MNERVRESIRSPFEWRAPSCLLLGLLALGASACASPGIPPGGPPDKIAPVLRSVTPDTNSLNVKARTVLFRFDEVVNERSTPVTSATGAAGQFGGSGGTFNSGNASTLSSLVLVSPGDGRERITWRRTAIEVEPRNGFRPNTTYRVTILPGLSDLRGNVQREPIEVVFSTGATRTESAISGTAFDWVGNKVAPNARVEVFTPADTMVRWSARADSTGHFVVRDLAPGTYRLRGFVDANGNREIDARELFDSVTVTVDSTLATELYAFAHDTVGPRVESLEPIDSTALRVKFDRGVAIDWSPNSTTLVLMASDSSYVPLGAMMPATVFDSLAKAALAATDTAKKPASDSAAGADTAGADTARAAARAEAARRSGRAAADTGTIKLPKLNRPVPILTWVVPFGTPIKPGDYRLKIHGVRGLSGNARDSEREFRYKPPAPPKDSTAAKPAGTPAPTAGTPAPSAAPVKPPTPATPAGTRPPAERPSAVRPRGS